jgi:integrase
MSTRTNSTPARTRSRGHGEGSIFQRRSDGRWCAQLDVNGKKWRKYFKTRKEAAEALHRAVQERRQGRLVLGPSATLAEYLELWSTEAQERLRPPVAEVYRRHLDLRILPYLGRERLDALTPPHIAQWLADLQKAGVSVWTRHNVYGVLSAALTRATKLNLIVANPMANVPKPKRPASRQKLWTPEQARAFFETAKTEPEWPLWELIATTGMRIGEVLALTWDDIQWDESAIRVERRVRPLKGRGLRDFGPPKTRAGARLVPVPPAVLATLRRHRAWVAEQQIKRADCWRDRGLIFPSLRIAGEAQYGASVLHRFQRLTDRLGLPRTRLHNLRHLYATSLLVRNVHPKIVQAVLGHSSIDVTLNTYSQYVPGLGKVAAQEIASVYGLDEPLARRSAEGE